MRRILRGHPYWLLLSMYLVGVVACIGLAAIGAVGGNIAAMSIGAIMAAWYLYRTASFVRLGKRGWNSMRQSADTALERRAKQREIANRKGR